MKIIIFFIISILVAVKNPVLPDFCNVDTAKGAIPPRIHFEQTVDGRSQNIFITRFIHNKVGIFVNEFGLCYLAIIDLNYLAASLGLVGMFFWLYLFYRSVLNKNWKILALIALVPLFAFFNYLPAVVPWGYKIMSIGGLALFLKKS